MELIKILLILIAFFFGLVFLVHICSKNKCALKYSSKKRKIEICHLPNGKSHPYHR